MTIIKAGYDILGARKRIAVIPETYVREGQIREIRVVVINEGKNSVSVRAVRAVSRRWLFLWKRDAYLYRDLSSDEGAPIINPGGNWEVTASDLRKWFLSSHIEVEVYKGKLFRAKMPHPYRFARRWTDAVHRAFREKTHPFSVLVAPDSGIVFSDEFASTGFYPFSAIAEPTGDVCNGVFHIKQPPDNWQVQIGDYLLTAYPHLFQIKGRSENHIFVGWSEGALKAVKSNKIPKSIL